MVQRITGLASGMDIDSIVSKMVQAKRAPIDKMVQQRQILQWQRETYRDMNTKFLDFRNNKMSNYRMATTYNMSKATVGGNTEAISAKTNGVVTGTNMTIEVKSLATAATNVSTEAMDLSKFDANGKLTEEAQFSINGYSVKAEVGDTMETIVSKISKSTNVSAFYDKATQQVSLVAKNTGRIDVLGADGKTILEKNTDVITFAGDFLANTLKLKGFLGADSGDPNKDSVNKATKAKVAEVSINGLETIRDSNTFTVDGVEITLLNKSNGAPTTITMSKDTDKLVDLVKSFVSDYNEMLATLNGILDEKRYRDYAPLTEEQKKDMKETQIEQWEKKAKSGLLYNDTILGGAVRSMRYAVMSKVDLGTGSKYTTLSTIGITTGKYTENGKLYLDEAKLRKAIEADPDAVKNLLSSKGTPKLDTNGNEVKDSSGNVVLQNVGIAEQMYKSFNTAQKDIMKKIGYTSTEDNNAKDQSIIGKQIYNLTKQILAGEDRLSDLETRYYKQFSAMESAVNKANSQSAALSRAFS
ncbi:flagellar filament capping protein FliD [Gorillibacterium sp. CAU 1737]|uniref:flagellar filament capping protein FliD n=1 Tax=Gorillibacterium sp. CAU 1737 TaxID=3140362 RepID=UPI0032615B7F